MKLVHKATIGTRKTTRIDRVCRVQAVAWSPNNKRLAVCDDERQIVLSDGEGEHLLTFPTKPQEKEFGKNSYVVTGIAFSPECTRLAVAQSDEVVYVYRLPEDRDKSQLAIVQKVVVSSPVTSVEWLPQSLIFGTKDGSLYRANGKKADLIFQGLAQVEAIVGNTVGSRLISVHTDGSVYLYHVNNEGPQQPKLHLSIGFCPDCVVFTGEFTLVGGPDGKIRVYDKTGKFVQEITSTSIAAGQRFSAGTSSANGRHCMFCTIGKLVVLSYSPKRGIWSQSTSVTTENLLTVPQICWRKDGTRVALGTITGCVEILECIAKNRQAGSDYEILQVTADQGVIRNPAMGREITYQTFSGLPIERFSILKDSPLAVGTMTNHLFLAGLESGLCSEIKWDWIRNPNPMFFVDKTACIIFADNQLHVLELGQKDLLQKVASTNFYSRFFSVKLEPYCRWFAFLPNRKTARIVNLDAKDNVVSMKHDVDLDWIVLSEKCTVMLAKDIQHRLIMFDVRTKERSTLSERSGFVELLQGTDILVVQDGSRVRIWYDVSEGRGGLTETSTQIEGKITDVFRTGTQIEVRTQHGSNSESYILNDPEQQFDAAIEKNQLTRAFDMLARALDSAQTKMQWETLLHKAIDSNDFSLAEKVMECNNDARLGQLKDLTGRLSALQKQSGKRLEDVVGNYAIKAELEGLKGNLASAEQILLSQRDHKRAIIMYSKAGRYIQALKIAEKHEPALAATLIAKYQNEIKKDQPYQLAEILAYTEKYAQAARTILSEPKLKPVESYRLLVENPKMLQASEGRTLLDKTLTALQSVGLQEMSGKLLEIKGDVEGALQAYKEAHAYDAAIALSRVARPEDVVSLEVEYARYLVKIRKWHDATTHFLEAHMNEEALEAAISCHDFKRAAEILAAVDDQKIVNEYGQRLAIYFQDREEFAEAVAMYKLMGRPKDAIQMYLNRGKIEDAYKYASATVGSGELVELFRHEAKKLIENNRYDDAEQIFVKIGDVDSAIDMYRGIQQFNRMIALVKSYKPHALSDTYLAVAEAYKQLGSLRQAELYFAKGGRNKELVQMYVEQEKWPDAYRCASEYMKEMADDILYLWINQLPLKEGLNTLKNMSAVKAYIRAALKSGDFENAYNISTEAAPDMIPEVLTRRAAALGQAGRHAEAEKDYIAAGRPDQAIQMYIDFASWPDAIRLTSQHYPEELPNLLMSHAGVLVDAGNYQEAESTFISLNKPEYAVQMYREHGMMEEALRVARDYLPQEAQSIELELNRSSAARPQTTNQAGSLLKQAREREEQSDYSAAVQAYLRFITDNANADSKQVLRVCGRIRQIATSFLGDAEAKSALDTVAKRYLALDQPKLAAAAFFEGNQHDSALQLLMDNGEWEEARSVVQSLRNPVYTQQVEARYREYLRIQGKAEQLASVDAESAVEIYARNGEWDKCLRACKELRDMELLSKYLQQYGLILIQSGDERKAVKAFIDHGVPVSDGNIQIYRHIFASYVTKRFKQPDEGYRSWVPVRDLLFEACANFVRRPDISIGATAEFEKYLQIAIYYTNHFALISEEATKELGWQILVALLRYSDVINPDKAFYDAGQAARELGWTGTADVLLNFYLDWRECILHQSDALVDYNDFEGSDIPTNPSIPAFASVTDEEFEDVKRWIMKAAVEGKLKYELKKDERGVFEISLSGGRYPPCVLTGYPVLGNGVKFESTGRWARRTELNRFLTALRNTRNDKLEETRLFLVKFCKASTELNYGFV